MEFRRQGELDSMGIQTGQYDSAKEQIASIATKAKEDEAIDAIEEAINVCEREGVPREDRVDVIVDGYRLHMEQEVEMALQKLERSLKRFSGL